MKQVVQTYIGSWLKVGQKNQQAANTLLQLYQDDSNSIFLDRPQQISQTGGNNIVQSIHCKLGKFEFDGQQLTMDMADIMGDNSKRLFHVQIVGKFQWDQQSQINIPQGWQNFSLSWITLVSKQNNNVSAKILGEVWKPVVQYQEFSPTVGQGNFNQFFGQVVSQFYQFWMKGQYESIMQFYNQSSKCLHGDKSDTLVGQQNIAKKMHEFGKVAFDKVQFEQVKACSIGQNQHLFLVNIWGLFQLDGQTNAMMFTQSWTVQLTGNSPVILNDFFKPVY